MTEQERHHLAKQLEAAAHDASSLESRLNRMIRTVEGSFNEASALASKLAEVTGVLTVEDCQILIDVRTMRLNIHSGLDRHQRATFDRLYELLDRLLGARI